MSEIQRAGEVIEASTTGFVAQCYELYQSPPLGSLVKTTDLPVELYGIVYNATTTSLEPGRRPIARGKNETSEEEIYRSSPQLSQLLRSEFSALVVGYRENEKLHYHLPSIHHLLCRALGKPPGRLSLRPPGKSAGDNSSLPHHRPRYLPVEPGLLQPGYQRSTINHRHRYVYPHAGIRILHHYSCTRAPPFVDIRHILFCGHGG